MMEFLIFKLYNCRDYINNLMKQQIYKKRKSLNFLAKTKLGKYINKMICSHLLYAHFNAVDEYLSESLIHPDEVLEKALQKSIEAGLPVMNISANEGKLCNY